MGQSRLSANNGVDFGQGQAKYMRLHNSKTEPVKCSAAVEGLIYYDPSSRSLRVCNGKNYFGLSVAVGDGSVLSPGKSCKSILDSGSSKGDSTYWLDPDGANGPVKPFQAFCDMKGGGWTKVTETTNYAYKVWCESACEKSYVYGLSSAQIDAIRALSNSAKQTYACETKGVGNSYNLRGWDGKLFAVSTACWAANNSDHKKSSGSYTNFAVVPLKSWYSVDCGDASEGCAHNVGDAWFR